MMKRINYLQIMATTCAVALLCNGCASMHPATRAQVATQSGLMLGSGFGAALGDQIDSRHGSFWGSLLGGVAGMAIGAAAASSYDNQQKAKERTEYVTSNPANERRISRVNYEQGPELTISDIMLRDRNGNKQIDAGEDCQISFIIENVGDRPAYDVRPTLKAKGNGKRICSRLLRVSNRSTIKSASVIRCKLVPPRNLKQEAQHLPSSLKMERDISFARSPSL